MYGWSKERLKTIWEFGGGCIFKSKFLFVLFLSFCLYADGKKDPEEIENWWYRKRRKISRAKIASLSLGWV